MPQKIPPRLLAVAIVLSVLRPSALSAADWLQFGVDAAHNGYNRAEKGYSTADGNRLAFPAAALPLPADVAPVFLENVATPVGTRNLLFVVSRNGTALALNAADGALIWSNKPTPAAARPGA